MGQNKSKAKANIDGDAGSLAPGAGYDFATTKTKTEALAAPADDDTIGKRLQKRAAYGRVNDASLELYLHHLRRCGIKVRAAIAANLSYASVRNAEKADPAFAELVEEAKQAWIAEYIDDPIRKFGIDGVHKILLNQKTGETVEGELVIQPQLALAYARKFDPAYRDHKEVDVNVAGGVMVVTAPAQSPEQWQAKFRKRDLVDEAPRTLAPPDSGGSVGPSKGG